MQRLRGGTTSESDSSEALHSDMLSDAVNDDDHGALADLLHRRDASKHLKAVDVDTVMNDAFLCLALEGFLASE